MYLNGTSGKLPSWARLQVTAFDTIVDAHWTPGQAKPLVIGPDCNPIGGGWVNQFLRNASDVLKVYTYHNYVGYGLVSEECMHTSLRYYPRGVFACLPATVGGS